MMMMMMVVEIRCAGHALADPKSQPKDLDFQRVLYDGVIIIFINKNIQMCPRAKYK